MAEIFIHIDLFWIFPQIINPLGMPGPVRIAAMDAVIRSDHYPDPDCTALKEAISRREQVSADQDHLRLRGGRDHLSWLSGASARAGCF